LNLFSDLIRELEEPFPVFLVERIFDADDRVFLNELFVVL